MNSTKMKETELKSLELTDIYLPYERIKKYGARDGSFISQYFQLKDTTGFMSTSQKRRIKKLIQDKGIKPFYISKEEVAKQIKKGKEFEDFIYEQAMKKRGGK